MKTIPKKNRLLACLGILLLGFAIMAFMRYQNRDSYDPLSDVSIADDAVFLSMFPIDGFREADFSTYEGISLSKVSHVFPDQESLDHALRMLAKNQYHPDLIYLGLDPARITPDQVNEMFSLFPAAGFKIYLENRPLSKWTELKDMEYVWKAYLNLTTFLASSPRAKVYPFFAQEWIIADAENYLPDGSLKEDVAQRVFLISLFSDSARDCQIQPEDVEELFAQFHALLQNAKTGSYRFLDLSDKNIIFLGDSIFGNYSDRRSIPEQLHAMSGANVFNCGWGGATAAQNGARSFPGMLEALLSGDLNTSPTDSQFHAGLTKYLSDNSLEDLNSPDTILVLHYGINDYIQGIPVETSDRHDPYSLCGSMRNGIEQIQELLPEASVIIVIPNHIFFFQEGTEILSEQGSIYEDYINGLIRVAAEYHLPTLDDYHDVINSKKQSVHVEDGIHPNDYGRFQIAYALMHAISALISHP